MILSDPEWAHFLAPGDNKGDNFSVVANGHLVLAPIHGLNSVSGMKELVFEVTQEADGGFVAEALGESIFTEANTWEELRANVREVVKGFYFDRPAPEHIRLHLVRDELLAAS